MTEVRIYMAGDIGEARSALRRWAYNKGACFSLSPTEFIYTGGEERGFTVTLINYVRFPMSAPERWSLACEVASVLLVACGQASCSVVSSEKSERVVITPPGVRE